MKRGDTVEERKQFSQLLTVLAIVTDSKQLDLALDMESNPDWYTGGLDSLYDGDVGDAPARPNGDRAAGEDPSAAARQQEYKEKERAAEAAAPMDEAGGEEARGAGTAPEE